MQFDLTKPKFESESIETLYIYIYVVMNLINNWFILGKEELSFDTGKKKN